MDRKAIPTMIQESSTIAGNILVKIKHSILRKGELNIYFYDGHNKCVGGMSDVEFNEIVKLIEAMKPDGG